MSSPPTQMQSPLAQTQSPPVENFLATVLNGDEARLITTIKFEVAG